VRPTHVDVRRSKFGALLASQRGTRPPIRFLLRGIGRTDPRRRNAYMYASMEELPAVLAAGCLSLENLVSASAIVRGWGDKMVVWALAPPLGTGAIGLDGNFVGDDCCHATTAMRRG
jgi:hypothetical protein